jgi:methylenetetrahydrofolate dehydrogenase (NADP+)/methenyltetrahydrofolate cyclohydrolase
MAALLLNSNATILHAHSRTPNLHEIARQAEILVVAVGRAKMIDASYLRQGAVVVDVGINRDDQGKVVGDVDYESAATVASAITPVPGGVGPMTITVLLQNTVLAAERRV